MNAKYDNEYLNTIKKRIDELDVQKREYELKLKPINDEYHALINLLKTIDQAGYEPSYPYNGNLQKRILYSLKELGGFAAAKDIEKYMQQFEPGISSNSVTNTSSAMYKNKEILLKEKIGKKNIYKLKEE